MRAIITDLNFKNKYFGLIDGGRKYFFYLPKRLSSIFFEHLKVGFLIDFVAYDNVKVLNKRKAYEVSVINEIIQLEPYMEVYSLAKLKKDMKDVLLSCEYYLCVDFEMSMANYKEKGYKAEIIQAGYVLMDKEYNIKEERSAYILPLEPSAINKRTLKFLKLDFDDYLDQAILYIEFYEELKKMIDTYHPKIVTWGKNDRLVLNDSYEINKVKPITNNHDFMDLLKLHKDFFSLKDDIGLFKAYQIYYQELDPQRHDALEDATITKDILIAFLKVLKEI
ncbi:hypothetical protein LJC17_03780 [Acholeplasma sp. OttesenSCG-928-E16]|nr:hypothetical protein [Acholeplasma sp. OttesenSCG-928-E16]